MQFETLVLLRSIWKYPSLRDHLLAKFIYWVQEDVSRNDARLKLEEAIKIDSVEQFYSLSPIDLDRVNWQQCVEFFCLCYYGQRFRRPLLKIPSDDIWQELVNEKNVGPLSSHAQPDRPIKDTVPAPLVPLENILLSLGGIRMIYRSEPDLVPLLERGEVFNQPIELIHGELRSCHANTARFWGKQKKVLAIVTGCALSRDGLWRQHSWLLHKEEVNRQSHILETTTKREKYFGFVLTESESETFFQLYYQR